MNRRAFIKASSAVTTVGVTSLAGCTDGGDDGDGGGDGDSGGGQEPNQNEDTPEEPPDENETATSEGNGGDGDQNTVAMETENDEYYFDPIGLYVESGTTVTFQNESGSHSSTAYQESNGPAEVTRIPEDAEAWDSGILNEQGATFDQTFEVAGTYDYFCIPHKQLGMVGRIVVDEPGGPAKDGMPPDGEVPDSQTIVDEGAVPYSDFRG